MLLSRHRRQDTLPGIRTLWYITRGGSGAATVAYHPLGAPEGLGQGLRDTRPEPAREEVRAAGAADASPGTLWAGLEDWIVASVEERVIEIVCENLGVSKEQVTRSTSFIDDVGADSLDIVELVMELEEEFEITIPDEEAEKIKTVGEAIDYIERELAKK
jgi:acyl carrier protein